MRNFFIAGDLRVVFGRRDGDAHEWFFQRGLSDDIDALVNVGGGEMAALRGSMLSKLVRCNNTSIDVYANANIVRTMT